MKKKNNRIGLGTAAIGRPHYINIKENQAKKFNLDSFKQDGIMTLEVAYQQGVRYFDTAPGYGIAEQLLLDWIKEKEDNSIEVGTKWGYTYIANFDANASIHELKEHSLEKLNEQWKQSKNILPRLFTYQIHSATFETGVLKNDAILKRLLEIKNEHGIQIGLTTTGANQAEVLKMAIDIEVDSTRLFDLFQVTYNIFDQSLAAIVEKMNYQNKKLVIKEALANGRVFKNKKYPKYSNAYKRLQELGEKYKVGMDAIALRFCIDSIQPFKVLSGASNEKQLKENLKANEFKLEECEIQYLKELKVSPENYWTERKKLVWN